MIIERPLETNAFLKEKYRINADIKKTTIIKL